MKHTKRSDTNWVARFLVCVFAGLEKKLFGGHGIKPSPRIFRLTLAQLARYGTEGEYKNIIGMNEKVTFQGFDKIYFFKIRKNSIF